MMAAAKGRSAVMAMKKPPFVERVPMVLGGYDPAATPAARRCRRGIARVGLHSRAARRPHENCRKPPPGWCPPIARRF